VGACCNKKAKHALWHVVICCFEMLQLFGWGFRIERLFAYSSKTFDC